MRRNQIGRLLIFVVVGLLAGGLFGEIVGLLGGQVGEQLGVGRDNPITFLFTHLWADWGFGLGPEGGFVVDLFMIKFKIGLAIRINLASIVGLVVALYLEKWSR